MLKKILFLILTIAVSVCVCSCAENNDTNQPPVTSYTGDADTPKVFYVKETSNVKSGYDTYQALVDDFMIACENGDVEKLRSLYFDDFLQKTLEVTYGTEKTDEVYQSLKEEMMLIFDKEIYEYGSADIPSDNSPLTYVEHMFSGATGGEGVTGLAEEQVTNFINLRVFRDNGYRDHGLALIDGTWYIVV